MNIIEHCENEGKSKHHKQAHFSPQTNHHQINIIACFYFIRDITSQFFSNLVAL